MARTASAMIPLGTPAPDFELPDTEGVPHTLASYRGRPLLVMFICNHCPYVVHLKAGLATFARDYQPTPLAVVAINANDASRYPADAPARMKEEAGRLGYVFPYLFDESQAAAQAYTATCTPDFFLFDAGHRLIYRGQFDGSRPGNDEPVTGADLRAACDALLAGTPLPPDQRPSIGCSIKWKPGNEPSYFGR